MSMSRGTSRSRGRSRSRDGSRGREGSRGRKRSRRSRSRGRGRGRSRSRRWSRSSRSRCMYMRGLFSGPILCKTGPGGPGAAGGPPALDTCTCSHSTCSLPTLYFISGPPGLGPGGHDGGGPRPQPPGPGPGGQARLGTPATQLAVPPRRSRPLCKVTHTITDLRGNLIPPQTGCSWSGPV